MAGETIAYYLRSADGGTTPISGARMATVSFPSKLGTVPAAPSAVGGIGGAVVQKIDIAGTLAGMVPSVLLGLVGAAAQNLVLHYKAGDGTNQKVTIKNVVFHSPGNVEFRDPETGGMVSAMSLQWQAIWGDSDTVALMYVPASDT